MPTTSNPDIHCLQCGEPLSLSGHCWQHGYPPMDPKQNAKLQQRDRLDQT
jgi:hypothetical protein